MIKAIVFDLDGTLVQSEKLKAQSYAIAVQRLRSLPEPEVRAVEAYREIVGAARDAATRHIVERPDLEEELRPLMPEHDTTEPWQVLTNMRTSIYDSIVADPQDIRDNQWPHTVGLLRVARETYCRTALATMSFREEALLVQKALELESALDLVLWS